MKRVKSIHSARSMMVQINLCSWESQHAPHTIPQKIPTCPTSNVDLTDNPGFFQFSKQINKSWSDWQSWSRLLLFFFFFSSRLTNLDLTDNPGFKKNPSRLTNLDLIDNPGFLIFSNQNSDEQHAKPHSSRQARVWSPCLWLLPEANSYSISRSSTLYIIKYAF